MAAACTHGVPGAAALMACLLLLASHLACLLLLATDLNLAAIDLVAIKLPLRLPTHNYN